MTEMLGAFRKTPYICIYSEKKMPLHPPQIAHVLDFILCTGAAGRANIIQDLPEPPYRKRP